MGVVIQVLIARLAPEGEHPAAGHVERGHVRDARRHQPQQPVIVRPPVRLAHGAERAGMGEDQVLAVKAGKERCPSNGEDGDRERNRGNRDLPHQPAVLRHLLLVMCRVDDTAGSEEE